MGISIGIVGTGAFGATFINLFRNHPLVDRIALCDIDTEKLNKISKQFKIKQTI